MSAIDVYIERFGPAYRWIATATVMFGTIATTATATIVNVAMTDIMGAFGLGQDQVQWLSTAFLAAMTGTMLMTAWALGRFGYRATYIGSLGVFLAGSVIGAVSVSGSELIFARVLQGAASGIIQPLAMVVMSHVFPVEKRGMAMAVYGLGVVLAPAVGPTVGGILVDQYEWRYVFLVVAPFCIAGSIAGFFLLPGRDTPTGAAPPPKFDVVGAVLLAIALTTLLTGLSNGQRFGWSSDFVLGMFALASVTGIGFVVVQLTIPHPLLDLAVFASGRFSAGCVVAFAFGAGIYGTTYLVPLFVQSVQGYTPTRSGLLLMPAGITLGFVFPLAGRLGDRLPPHIPILIGLAIFGISCWLAGGVDVNTPFWTLALWVALGRLGLGLITPSLNAGALRALPHAQLAHGSGSLNFVRQLGGAFGVNILSVLIERRTVFHADALAQMLTPANPAGAETITRLTLLLGHWGNPFGDRLPIGIPPAAMAYLETMVVPKARLFTYQDGFYAVAMVFFLAMIPAWIMGRRRSSARS